jgi:hypothetical protein
VTDREGNALGATKSAALVDGVPTAFALVKRAAAEAGTAVRVAGADAHVLPPMTTPQV